MVPWGVVLVLVADHLVGDLDQPVGRDRIGGLGLRHTFLRSCRGEVDVQGHRDVGVFGPQRNFYWHLGRSLGERARKLASQFDEEIHH